MSDVTVVHLLRHGEVHNPAGVLYGRLPGYRLSTDGEAMARKAADWFAGGDVRYLVASPLERAQQTAAPFGVGDGALRRPANWWRLRNPWLPSWGEPYREIAARMLGAVATARDAARGSAAVCVSHQLPIWTLRLHLEGRSYLHDPRRRQCGLASVTSLTYDGDRLVRLDYAEPAGATDPGAVPGA
jgi:broad specificity phosphatase PhoE